MLAKRKTIKDIQAQKGGIPIVCLTAYSASYAKLLDTHVDVLLVGDSLGMVLYGMESTLGVTMEMMKQHGAAVARGSSQACIVVDLPFGSYQATPEEAFRNAADIMRFTGCTAVKLEGGRELAPTVRFLVERGIPVMGHAGLMPQSVHVLGGFRSQGHSELEGQAILDDALAVQDAGAFAIVLEGINEQLARKITEKLHIPTIGIGASPACDGQVLVTDDMLGLFQGKQPKFVKHYAGLHEIVSQAVRDFSDDVRGRVFPTSKHCYTSKS